VKRRNRREQAAELAAFNAAYDRATELSEGRALADALRDFATQLMREIEDAESEIEAEQESLH
jgi:RNA polymerase-binding transcription factor DksA